MVRQHKAGENPTGARPRGASAGSRSKEKAKVPAAAFLEAVESSEALAKSLRAGDALLIVNTPDGLARRVVKRARSGDEGGDRSSGLTAPEKEFLEGSGFSLAEPPLSKDPLIRGEEEYGRLVEMSLRTSQVARALGVTEGRIRQRLMTERTLLGIRTGKGWFVPRYQFQKGKEELTLIPDLDRVIPRLDPGLHPVTVHRWLTTPNPDLETDRGESLSPLGWLKSGLDVGRVADLAAEL